VRGTEPITLPNGEKRSWLIDGDEITFRAHASRAASPRSLWRMQGRIEPAVAWPAAQAARGGGIVPGL